MECATASELAVAMDQRVGQIAYHLKTLARGDILLPARRGSGEEHYGWTLGVEAEWLRLVLQVWAESDVSG